MSKEPKIKPIVIVGAGGMGRDTQWLIERINEEEPTYEILGYIDDGIQQGSIIDGYPILGGMKYLEEYDKEQKLAVAFAIGNAKVREKLVLKCLPNPNLWYPNTSAIETTCAAIGICSPDSPSGYPFPSYLSVHRGLSLVPRA